MSWLFLVGFMGVGKTTLGMQLAKRIERPFYDLDDCVEAMSGETIPALFARGEERFRRLESAALERLLRSHEPGVVATGGGAFTQAENRKLMERHGTSVWLDVPLDVLEKRVDGSDRPLWAERGRLRELADARRKDYRLATLHLELDQLSVPAATEALCRLVAPLV